MSPDDVRGRLKESADVHQALVADTADLVHAACELAIRTYREGGKLVLMGNGGSASDAEHIATELVGRYLKDRPPLAALSLSANTSLITAVANDYGYDQLFARQVEGLVAAGDLAIGLSTSGRSPNVVAGLAAARARGAATLGLTGEDPRDMAAECDLVIAVPSGHTPRIQEAHILIGHILCEAVEAAIFGGE